MTKNYNVNMSSTEQNILQFLTMYNFRAHAYSGSSKKNLQDCPPPPCLLILSHCYWLDYSFYMFYTRFWRESTSRQARIVGNKLQHFLTPVSTRIL
jgi:hypothetical protein